MSIRRTDDLLIALRSAIAQGTYAVGQPLPSERELCTSTRLSRTTVRRASQLLVDEGVVYRVPGSGTYVGRSHPLTIAARRVGAINAQATDEQLIDKELQSKELS